MEPHNPATPALSDALLDQLAAALGNSIPEREHESVQAAMDALCTEAHARALPPEAMVLAVRSAWQRVHQPVGIRHQDWTWAYYTLVGRCLTAYFSAK